MVNSVLVYDALGYSRDHPDYLTARGSIEKLLIVKDDEAYCQPCLVSGVGYGADGARVDGSGWGRSGIGCRSRLGVAQTAADPGHRRRLGGNAPRHSPRRLGISVRQPLLSRYRRHGGCRDGDGPRARPRCRQWRHVPRGHCARPRVERRDAEPQRRLGRLRRRQRPTNT